MAESDVDALLATMDDALEGRGGAAVAEEIPHTTAPAAPSSPLRGSGEGTVGETSDVDDLIAALDGVVGDDDLLHVSPSKSRAAPSSPPPLARRCFPVTLAGADAPPGCDALRCTSCDHDVLRIPGRRWAGDVSYLFFRNSVPDLRKLGAKLRRSPSECAYACQCSWTTVKGRRAVDDQLRWVCAGH